jgi:hypothetical protein
VRKVFGEELTRSAKLLQAFTVEGVSTVAEDDIVRDRDEPTASERVVQARSMGGQYSSGLLGGVMSEEGSARSLGSDGGGGAEDEPAPARSSRSSSPFGRAPRGTAEGEGAESEEDLDLGNIAEGLHEQSSLLEDTSAGVVEAPDDGVVRRTKKQFKAEYLRRKQHRDSVVARILERERRIAKVSQQLQALLTEVFFVCLYDSTLQRLRTLPVLAISYPALYKTHLPEVRVAILSSALCTNTSTPFHQRCRRIAGAAARAVAGRQAAGDGLRRQSHS